MTVSVLAVSTSTSTGACTPAPGGPGASVEGFLGWWSMVTEVMRGGRGRFWLGTQEPAPTWPAATVTDGRVFAVEAAARDTDSGPPWVSSA